LEDIEMKRVLLCSLAALSLAACATAPTVYQPATGPSGIGYSEYRIEPGRYRVMFQGGSSASPEQVTDLAILRAADLALADGYDWFRISDRYLRGTDDYYGYGYGYGRPHMSVGFGSVDYGHHGGVGVGLGAGFDLGGYGYGYGATAVTLEVFMGRGPKPPGVDVYDARAVRSTLGHPAAPA
jgi:opacity protein-like surface antigen